MKNILIVTRHQGLVEFLASRGIVGEVIPHATADTVRGRDVYGVLPLNLAAECRTVTTVDLNLPADKRGAELSMEEVEAFFIGMTKYVVRTKCDYNSALEEANDFGMHGMLCPIIV